jgi:transcriptional regulator of acetoin/glycerol metabolism
LRNTIERVTYDPGDVVDARTSRRRRGRRPWSPEDRPTGLRWENSRRRRTPPFQKLRENDWNISKTAETIGTPRSNLYKKLEQYNIRQGVDS